MASDPTAAAAAAAAGAAGAGPPTATELQGLVWGGAIPIELSMKEAEVTGLVPPLPHYALLPRCGYLPVAAADAIDRFLRGFVTDIRQGPFTRRLWFETTEGGVPLKWHLPGGVLYDLYGPRPDPHAYDSVSSDSEEEEEEDGKGKGGGRRRRRPRPQWAEEQEEGGGGGGIGRAPWRITVRFHDIPLDQVLELPVEAVAAREASMRHFRGRLKQACYLLHGGSGPAMALHKDDEMALWEAVASSSYNRYAGPAAKLLTDTPQRIPLRLLIEGQPPLHPSLPCDAYGSLTLREAIEKMAPHLFVSPSQDGGEEEEEGDDDDGDTRGGKQQQQRCWPSSDYAFTCQGLCPPPWDASLLDAWRSLLHADFYLYITARRVTTTAVEEKGKEAAVS